jgi:hypothetical protein
MFLRAVRHHQGVIASARCKSFGDLTGVREDSVQLSVNDGGENIVRP